MGVQLEAKYTVAKTTIIELDGLARHVESSAGQFAKAVDALQRGSDATKVDSNTISVVQSAFQAAMQALDACKSSVERSSEFIASNVKLTKDETTEAALASFPNASTKTEQVNDAPEMATDETIFHSGVYLPEHEAELELTDESAAQQAETFPTEILLENVNHLMFVVHGIGEHDDFVERKFDDEERQKGESSNFRELFSTVRDSLFSKEIPLSLEIVPVEWHAEVHQSGVDDVFDSICPENSKFMRGINRQLIMDVLYYSAPKYGQMIVDSVTKQMNDKYRNFMKSNPNWKGFVSIFAHSLGTLISYDMLTHDAGQVGANGVVFPGLNFAVENLFCAGSPVPIFSLSRGHLDFQDRKCTGGMRRPKVNHYYNLFHPADPIAYRVEPLVNVNMAQYPAVTLKESDSFKCKTFGEMVQVYDKLTEESKRAGDWEDARIDFQVRREGWDWVTGDLFAPFSHGVYWSSQDVVTIILMAICRPVVDILAKYLENQKPLPVLRPRRLVPFTPYKKIKIATTTLVRDGSTGEWATRAVFLARKRVYFANSASDVACSKKDSMWFTANSTVQEDPSDPLVFVFKPNNSTTAQKLKCSSEAQRQEWVDAIRKVLAECQSLKSPQYGHTVQTHGLELPSGTDVAFFDANLAGSLQSKGFLGWSNAWYVLTKTSLDCYKKCPAITDWEHFSIKNVFANPKHGHFRLVNRTGTSVTFKIKEQQQFTAWVQTMKEFENHMLTIEEECT
ncbi:Aste57867_10826 [Aphanomyces stellatus]|uniref:Aste57867_10826 protein n=1 Tax=Aphanomyces stellatus TaxID=120398 RepID=A0A485KS30_9STRA|nr:hypothetical protein As57867_010786 [Aphanomyces stellatus]VFT87694.1 Aste57867_10826 [Aphanomyces stellatus]